MPSPDDPPERRRVRPISVSAILLSVVLAAAAGGFIYLQSANPVKVFVAARDLPAFHQIEETDVREARLPGDELVGDAIRSRAALIGSYTLEAVKQDRPYRRSRLGPLLAKGTLGKLSFVATEASPVSTLGGRLARGDVVDVLLSPTDPDAAPGKLPAVLVLDVGKDSVVLGVTAKDAKTLLRARGTSSVALLRVRAYASPL